MGHLFGAGATKEGNEFQNKVIAEFLATLKK